MPARTSQSLPAPPAPTPTSQSPVPYLFGGLASLLGVIALALLVLACSYWKLSRYHGAAADSSTGDPDGSNKSPAAAAAAPASPAAFGGLVAVVMAGETTPTFLAAPADPAGGGGLDDGEGERSQRPRRR